MLTILHGKDTLRSRMALRELVAGEGAHTEVLQEDSAFDRIRIALENAPLFGGNSFFVVEDGITGALGTQLSGYARLAQLKEASHVHLVLYEGADVSVRVGYKALAPYAAVQLFAPLSPAAAVDWLSGIFSKSTPFKRGIVSAVLSRCQGDMWSAYQELAKLSAYCAGEEATEHDLDVLGVGAQGANVFATIDEIFAGHEGSSFERLQLLWQEGQSPMGVFALLERQLRIVVLAKEAVEGGAVAPGMVAKAAGIPPFAAPKAIAVSRRMSWIKIKGLYARVESLDEKMKRGAIDPYFAVELFASAVLA